MKKSSLLILFMLSFGLAPCFLFAQVETFNMEDLNDLMVMNASDRGDNGGSGGDAPGGGDDGGSGGAPSNIKILTNLPTSSKVKKENMTLEWRASTVKGPYEVSVKSLTTGNSIFSSVVTNNCLTLPLSELHVENGQRYKVEVNSQSNRQAASRPAAITIASADEYAKVLDSASMHDEFSSAGKLKQTLMKAMALELNDYIYDASRMYRSQMDTDSDMLMLLDMRNDFVERTGL